MSNKNSTIVDFSILLRIASLYGVEITRGWQVLLAEKMGLKNGGLVSAWKKRGVPNEVIAETAIKKGIRKEWIETGQGEKYSPYAPSGADPPQETRETPPGYSNQPLKDDELRLIKLYRNLHPAEQEKVIEIAELYNNVRESRENAGGGSDLKESNSK